MFYEYRFAFLAPCPFLVGGAVEGFVSVVPFPEVGASAVWAISEGGVGVGVVISVSSREVIFLGEDFHPFLCFHVYLLAYDWGKGVLDYHFV